MLTVQFDFPQASDSMHSGTADRTNENPGKHCCVVWVKYLGLKCSISLPNLLGLLKQFFGYDVFDSDISNLASR